MARGVSGGRSIWVAAEALRNIRSGKNAYADLGDVDTVMAAMERRTLGLARLEAYGLLEKADRALKGLN